MGFRTILNPKEREKVEYPIKVYILEKRKGKFEIDDKERGRRIFDDAGNEYLELKLRKIKLMPHHYGEIIRTRDGDLAVFLYAHGPEEIYPIDFKFKVEQEFIDPHTGEKMKGVAFMPINLSVGELTKTGEIIDLEAIPKIDPKARQWFAQQLLDNQVLYPEQKPNTWVQALPWVALILVVIIQAWIFMQMINNFVPAMKMLSATLKEVTPVFQKLITLIKGA